MTTLVLAVGHDLGSRFVPLEDERITVGRHKSADLVIVDASVSRRHLEARRVGEGAEIRIIDGAMPFYYRGKATKQAKVTAGDHIIVGSTVLSVLDTQRAAAASPLSSTSADLATMIDGLALEVRGFAAVVRLVEALRTASDRRTLDLAIASWPARSGVGASMALVESDDSSRRAHSTPTSTVLDSTSKHDAALLTAQGRTVTMRIPGHERLALVVEARGKVDDALRALVLVAAQVIAARLGDLRTRANLEEDVRALRTMSLGSARDFLGDSPAAREVARVVPKLAVSASTALLLGESGTGKTFVARLVHEASTRRDEPLRVVNCAAIPEALLEAELFGAERGAYSGAVATRVGAFEAAGAGTLLLDEVGELPLTSQAKLLRALEDRRFERVGSNRSLPLEARVIAATNRDLEAMVKAGTFRADLLFRIGVVTVVIPSLRERGDDVVLLARRLLADLATTAPRRVEGFTPAAVKAIREYPWPGNVRELRNAIEHALVLGEHTMIDVADLPASSRRHAASGMPEPAAQGSDGDIVRLPARLALLEVRAIEAALRATNGNRTRAAALLGINRVTLQKKLRKD